MPLILLLLALVLVAAAAALWIAAARQESAYRETALSTAPQPEKKLLTAALPGAARRERREWAQARGYEYQKSDDYWAEEFVRGAAAGGHTPKEVVVGQVLGHEMVLMDLGAVTVMAMRTGAAAEVVVDFRRRGAFGGGHPGNPPGNHPDEQPGDLVEVGEEAGFQVYASDAAVAQRLLEVRVRTALAALPAEVEAVWLEYEWALAQFGEDSHPVQWEALQAPLALLADAARVLPPRSHAAQVLDLGAGDPSRLMAQEAAMLAQGPVMVADTPDAFEHPPVSRPEEPVDLPTRKVGIARGPVTYSAVGADEVDAIADGNERPQVDATRPRMRRTLDKESTIFDA